jgi:hypothetical protein
MNKTKTPISDKKIFHRDAKKGNLGLPFIPAKF